MESDDNTIGVWAALAWTAVGFGILALIALFSKFPG